MRLQKLEEAKKPLIVLGQGARVEGIKEFVEKLNIPVFLTWGAMDLLEDNHPLNMRDFGITSQRVGNFAMEVSDFILVLGSRLDTHQPINGQIYHVECDENEFREGYHGLVEDFIKELEVEINPNWNQWRENILKVKKMFNYSGFVYEVFNKISSFGKEGDIIITDAGQTLTWTMQTWKVKKDQRIFSAFNNSPMGYSIPAIVGAYHAFPDKRIFCFIGDGGFQMNLQELQTIKSLGIKVAIFVIDNNGYGMIMQTLNDWDSLDKNVACKPSMPNLEKIAIAYGFDYFKLEDLSNSIEITQPTIINVKIPENSKIENKLKFGSELTDLSPKLTEEQKEEIYRILNEKINN